MGLTIQLVPYAEIEGLSSLGKIKKLLNLAKDNKIVMLQGRLKKEEEAELIKTTMEEINNEFKGIELSVLPPGKSSGDVFKRMRSNVINSLLGNRQGLTVIGPASVIKEIKKDPHKIQLLTRDISKKKRKR